MRKWRCTSVGEPLDHIHQDTKSTRLIAVCKRSFSIRVRVRVSIRVIVQRISFMVYRYSRLMLIILYDCNYWPYFMQVWGTCKIRIEVHFSYLFVCNFSIFWYTVDNEFHDGPDAELFSETSSMTGQSTITVSSLSSRTSRSTG